MKMIQPNPRVRTITALLISLLPSGALRVFFYELLLRHKFGRGSRIGFFTIIACSSFKCGHSVVIGRNNLFIGPISVDIGDEVVIGRFNKFVCGHIARDSSLGMNYTPELVLQAKSLIFDSHYFDVYGRIDVGEGTWIAGVGSQFWTHGASVMDRDIKIGSHCFIGSAVRFAPGSAISDRSIVGLGSVVIEKHAVPDVVLSGLPAKVVRSVQPGETRNFVFEFH